MCEIRENAMQKKQFQQNMKDKVRVFEDGGIRLLKRGQKGVVHAIFSRFGLVLVLLLLQAFALFSLLQWFGELLPHYFGGTLLVTAAMMVYLLNQDMDNSVRITWLVVTALAPVLGLLGIPPETAALLLVRPVSGSGALAVGSQIMEQYGPDSAVGRTAAVMLGCSETTFYTVAVYFGAAGIRRTRYTIPAALTADLAAFVAAAWAVRLCFG